MARSAKSQRAADALQDACCARKARSVYSSARTNPQATTLAPPELQKADEWLNKAADAALSKGDDVAVSQLAGLAKQQVAIAQETTKRKAPEQAVVEASAQRDQVRLAARAAEAEAVRRQRSSHGRPPTASCAYQARIAEQEQKRKQLAPRKRSAAWKSRCATCRSPSTY